MKMDQSLNNVFHVKQEPMESDYTTPEKQPQNKQATLTENLRLVDQFCRLCLRQRPDLVPLLSRIRDMSVLDVFRVFTGLEMTLDDIYPLKTCRTCMAMLDFAFDIHQTFTESYRILKTFVLSKSQPLTIYLSDYQGGVRATSETPAERMLREYRDLVKQKKTGDPHVSGQELNQCVIIPQPQEESIKLPFQIKHEPELDIPTEIDDPYATAQNLSPGVIIPQLQKEPIELPVQIKHEPELDFPDIEHEAVLELPIQIKHEPELILEPEELPGPANNVADTITNSEESSTGELSEIPNVAQRKKLDPNKCYICDKVFEATKDAQIHLSEHEKMVPYQCSACTTETGQDVKVTSLDLLHSHFRMHASEIKCSKCPYRTQTRLAMKKHMRTNHVHSGQTEYICDQCGYKCWNKRSFNYHIRSHKALDEGQFTCSCCDKMFSSKANLVRHERIHSGQRPYQCDACDRSFRLRWLLNRHISKVHTKSEHVDEGPTLTCKFEGCNFNTTNKPKYYRHMAKHELKFQCSHCSERFPSGRQLQQHQHVHTGVKDFQCGQCDKSFQSKLSLDEHVAGHNNDRPYACEICGFSFVRKRNLKQHLLKHSAQLSFECQHCGMKFRYRRKQMAHEKTHMKTDVELINPNH